MSRSDELNERARQDATKNPRPQYTLSGDTNLKIVFIWEDRRPTAHKYGSTSPKHMRKRVNVSPPVGTSTMDDDELGAHLAGRFDSDVTTYEVRKSGEETVIGTVTASGEQLEWSVTNGPSDTTTGLAEAFNELFSALNAGG